MAKHSGGKVGAAASRLSKDKGTKAQKSKDAKTLADHKHEKHKK